PVPHVMHGDRDVVDLAVVEAAFLALEDLEGLLLRADCGEAFFRERQRNLLIARAMQEQERTRHLLHDAVESESFELLERRRLARSPEHRLEMPRRHRQGEHLAGRKLVEPLRPDGVIVPLRPPGDAAGEAWLERGGARRVVTAKAQRHHPNAARIELATGGEILVGGGGVALGLGDERQVAATHPLPLSLPLAPEASYAARGEGGDAGARLRRR